MHTQMKPQPPTQPANPTATHPAPPQPRRAPGHVDGTALPLRAHHVLKQLLPALQGDAAGAAHLHHAKLGKHLLQRDGLAGVGVGE